MASSLAQRLLHKWRTRTRPAQPRLRLVETLALGGRRYLALVECDGQPFLLGGKMDAVLTIASAAPGMRREVDEADLPSSAGNSSPDIQSHPIAAAAAANAEPPAHTTHTGDTVRRWLGGTITLRVHRGGKPVQAGEIPPTPISFANVLSGYATNAAQTAHSDDPHTAPATSTPAVSDTEPEENSIERELIRWAAEQSRLYRDAEEVA